MDDRPQDLQDTVLYMLKNKIDKLFPSIFQMMQLTLMLPVCAADTRSTMLQDRLNALILLYVHKDIKLDYEDIVDKYARRNPRRMQLMNPLSE